MDRRIIYLQELLQVSDVLQMQRNAMNAVADLAFAMLGTQTVNAIQAVVACMPSGGNYGTDRLPGVSGLSLSIPPLQMFEQIASDTIWPASPNTILSADSTVRYIQALAAAQTLGPITPPSGSNVQSFLVEARIGTAAGNNDPQDNTLVTLPYYPLLQTTIVADAGNNVNVAGKAQFKVASHAGMVVGDSIIVAGATTGSGTVATIFAKDIGGVGTPNLQLNTTLSVVTTGFTVRDVNPNSGNPLAGPTNANETQNINRTHTIFARIISGVAQLGSSPVPNPSAGFVPLWALTNVPNGAVNLTAYLSKATNAPFLAGLAGASSHHKGIPGHAAKIDNDLEMLTPCVKRTGDNMTGDLVNSADVIARILKTSQGQLKFSGPLPGIIDNTTTVPSVADAFVAIEVSPDPSALSGILADITANGMVHLVGGQLMSTRQPYWRDSEVIGAENFGKVSFNAGGSGSIKFPNGFKIAWGTDSGAASGGTGIKTVTFNGSGFGTACYGAIAITNSGSTLATVSGAPTTGTATFNTRTSNTGSLVDVGFYYIAWGK